MTAPDERAAFEEVVAAVIAELIAASPAKLDDYRHGRRGAFGYFAGRTVGGVRRQLGRELAEAERRLVWQRIWERLEALQAAPPGETD
jgi:Asp-tRNA(Asn)/Glu-tRNA(Gln) amidotransferase B subunit